MDRVKFKEIVSSLSPEKLVFCDEMGVDDNSSFDKTTPLTKGHYLK